MNKYIIIITILLINFVACNSTTDSYSAPCTIINVTETLDNPTELKLSMLGDTVVYIPLETTNDGYIGSWPRIRAFGKIILISSSVAFNAENLCFDGESGNYLGRIGHKGNDPEGYSDVTPFYNHENESFYFIRNPNTLQKYDKTGKHSGKVNIPMVSGRIPDQFTFKDSLIIGAYENSYPPYSPFAFITFTETGELKDSICIENRIPSQVPEEQEAQMVYWNPVSKLGTIYVKTYKDGRIDLQMDCKPSVWRQGKEVRFKTGLNDTIYTLEQGKLQPLYVFHLGNRNMNHSSKRNAKSLTTTGALESDNTLYFQCIGNITGKPEQETVQTGIYNKRTEETYMADNNAPLTDDLNGFLPFDIDCCGEGGEFAGILKAEDIVNWLEEHPEAKSNPALTPLLEVKEEDNPVVAIVKKK